MRFWSAQKDRRWRRREFGTRGWQSNQAWRSCKCVSMDLSCSPADEGLVCLCRCDDVWWTSGRQKLAAEASRADFSRVPASTECCKTSSRDCLLVTRCGPRTQGVDPPRPTGALEWARALAMDNTWHWILYMLCPCRRHKQKEQQQQVVKNYTDAASEAVNPSHHRRLWPAFSFLSSNRSL